MKNFLGTPAFWWEYAKKNQGWLTWYKVYLQAILSQNEADLFKAEGGKYFKPGYFEYKLIGGGKGIFGGAYN